MNNGANMLYSGHFQYFGLAAGATQAQILKTLHIVFRYALLH